MDPIVQRLEEKWIPALVSAWRRASRSHGPAGELLPSEVKQVAAGVRRLSQGLTRERELVGARYMDDPELLGAYLLFYWPISYAQGRSVLGEIPRPPRSALDLGSGPGPLAMAALDRGAARIVAADRSARALEVAGRLAEGADLRTVVWDGHQASGAPEGRFDLITLGHVLNELWSDVQDAAPRRARLVEGLLDRLEPGGSLVVVEPALRETSRALLEVRDFLVAKGASVRAPCLFRGSCPALEKASDWCHAERPWAPPRLVQAIADEAKVHKNSLKMSYLVVAAPGEEQTNGDRRRFRIVSEPLPAKGRLRYMGCGPEGRLGLSLQTRHLGEANRAFADLARGDVIEVEGTVPKGDGWAIEADGSVRLVARAGEPA